MRTSKEDISKAVYMLDAMSSNYDQTSDEWKALDLATMALSYFVLRDAVPVLETFLEEMHQDLTPEEIEYIRSMGVEP